MLLGQGNHVYLDVKPGSELRVGQQLTLFEQSRKPEPSKAHASHREK